jgi:dodecin
MAVLKVIELVGISSEGWGAAARGAVQEASKTIRHIEELEVLRSTATVREGEIVEYRVQVKLTFRIEDEQEPLEAVEAAEAILLEPAGELDADRDPTQQILDDATLLGNGPPP